jgi:hypothetical protein
MTPPLDWALLQQQDTTTDEPRKRLAKRKDPTFCSSSFYVRRACNNAFDRALLDLKTSGIVMDRSDALELLMSRFAADVQRIIESTAGDDERRIAELETFVGNL